MLRVKGQDGFLPIGPELAPAAEFDPTNFTLRTYLNGEVVQEATADDMIWGVAYQLADLCRLITLEPGDVVLTGTPANSRPMEPGDVVAVEIERPRPGREHGRRLGRRSHGRRRAAGGVGEHVACRARDPRGRGRADGGEQMSAGPSLVETFGTPLSSDDHTGVTTIRVLYPDLHGVARGKDVPISAVRRASSSTACASARR